MKYYIVTTFDQNEHKKVYYYTRAPISSDDVNMYMGAFSFLINRDSGTDYLYFLGRDDKVVYRVFIDDIISIEVKNDE